MVKPIKNENMTSYLMGIVLFALSAMKKFSIYATNGKMVHARVSKIFTVEMCLIFRIGRGQT